ncbi:MAG: serine/threonine-protein kinase [Leptolyngbyaceae cyanobacterium MO_188.B28]|nr:serine/threonine-protein kinase [Leptolyngbyaceae cyanobacterium MO_188.B28]
MKPEVRERGAGVRQGTRYRMIRELGRGGFGHTYLAEDTHRFNELCVLKEFMPQVEGESALQKAKQLFEREAGVLYQLKHPQIPQFRELLRVQSGGKGHLFLVQDYVEGPTYRQLMYSRQNCGQCFSEAEVRFLLEHLLPVLDYIHSVGVIHRDIAPDNLILRNVDSRPVLIDFGGVKQVAAKVGRQLCAADSDNSDSCSPEPGRYLTRLGKVGYAPEEQIESGLADPSSDLYSLAATVLTLLTGQQPQDLYDPNTRNWRWRQELRLDSQLGAVLDRMLSPRVSDRYPSAQAVMQALQIPYAYSQTSLEPMSPAIEAFSGSAENKDQERHSGHPGVPRSLYGSSQDRDAESDSPRQFSGLGSALLGLVLLVGVVVTAWWAIALSKAPENEFSNIPNNLEHSEHSPDLPEAKARKEELDRRQVQMGIDPDFLVRLTNQIVGKEPNFEKQQSTDGFEEASYQVGLELLEKIEVHLNPTVIPKLGSYGRSDLEQWRTRVNQIDVSRLALHDLADARFFSLFPEQRDQDFFNRPIGQIWYAMVEESVDALESGDLLKEVQFKPGAFGHTLSDRLQPFQGKVYTMHLGEGQLLRLNLQAPAQTTQLSLYVPHPTINLPFLLADDQQSTWSAQLPQTGYYKVVIVSTSAEPITFDLDISVDNVQSTLP